MGVFEAIFASIGLAVVLVAVSIILFRLFIAGFIIVIRRLMGWK